MNDLDMTLGKYRATVCEWLPKKACGKVPVDGTAYCEEHLKLAYHQPKQITLRGEKRD